MSGLNITPGTEFMFTVRRACEYSCGWLLPVQGHDILHHARAQNSCSRAQNSCSQCVARASTRVAGSYRFKGTTFYTMLLLLLLHLLVLVLVLLLVLVLVLLLIFTWYCIMMGRLATATLKAAVLECMSAATILECMSEATNPAIKQCKHPRIRQDMDGIVLGER